MTKYIYRVLAWWENRRGSINEGIQEHFLDKLDTEIIDELYLYDTDGALGQFYDRRTEDLIAEQERMLDEGEWRRGCGR